jgi:hypothetical protein
MTQKTIGPMASIAIVGTALVFDGLQFLLTLTVVGTIFAWFLSAFAWILFLLWFALLGVSYFGRGAAIRFLTVFASAIAELMPVVNALPALTLGVVALIVQHNIEVRKQQNLPTNDQNRAALARRAAARWESSRMRQAGQAARNAREAPAEDEE